MLTLIKLRELIEERLQSNPKDSYVVKTFKKGRNKIAQKFGEEAVEVTVAYLAEDKNQVIYESADLLFHLSLLWKDRDVAVEEVMAELERRMGIKNYDIQVGKEKG